jgi:hypothetical protein
LCRFWVPLSVAALACGRFGYDELPGAADGSPPQPDALAPGQDSDAAGPIELAPFTEPIRIEALVSSANDDDPTVTGDLLELYFESARPGGPGQDSLWVSRRSSPDEPWGEPALVFELSSESQDSGPGIASDGLTIWFNSDRPGGAGGQSIWTASRPDRASPWSTPAPVPELSSPANDSTPEPQASGLAIVFMSDRAGGAGGLDIYIATRAAVTDPWDPPMPIEGINTPADEFDPFLSADGRHIFFAAVRPEGQGERDIYVATRDSPGGAFGAPVPVVELNSPARDTDVWLSPDLGYAVLVSDRDGRRHIYEAFRAE